MSEISGMNDDALKEALHGRIFYNPLQKEYEISERWIAGNVVEKAQEFVLFPNPSVARGLRARVYGRKKLP